MIEYLPIVADIFLIAGGVCLAAHGMFYRPRFFRRPVRLVRSGQVDGALSSDRSLEQIAVKQRRREIEANIALEDARERIADLTAINSQLQHENNRLTAADEARKAALAKATEAARVVNIARGADARALAAIEADHRRKIYRRKDQ